MQKAKHHRNHYHKPKESTGRVRQEEVLHEWEKKQNKEENTQLDNFAELIADQITAFSPK